MLATQNNESAKSSSGNASLAGSGQSRDKIGERVGANKIFDQHNIVVESHLVRRVDRWTITRVTHLLKASPAFLKFPLGQHGQGVIMEKLLSPVEISRATGIPLRSVHRLNLPFIRLNPRSKRVRQSDFEAFLKANVEGRKP